MSRDTQKPQILLDWATISYKSILRFLVYVVLILALGGVVYYLNAAHRGTPQVLALQDIQRAESLHRDAQTTAGSDEKLQRTVERAANLLASARLSYDRQEYPDARSAAQESQTFSQKVLEGSGGEAFTAKIYAYEGDIKIKRARQFVWGNIGSSTSLQVGDQIKTASNGSAQVIYFDGTITTIKPGSLLEIRELYEDPATRVRKVREKLNWGGVSASSPGANVEGSFHEVATDSTTARAVDRARFDVAFDAGTRSTRTEVQSGSAEVETGGKTLTLKPLERMDVDRDRVVSRQKVPPAPGLLEPADQRVFQSGDAQASPTTLQWARVDAAARYRLQMARSALFGDMLLDKSDIRSTSVRIPGLQEGTYYWRVSAIDGREMESAFSEARRFKVAGAQQERSDDRLPPQLALVDFLPSGHLVIINGRTEPGASLSVAGQKVDVYDDGAFTAVVRMKREGLNDIEIVAQDSAGNETRLKRSVYVESF